MPAISVARLYSIFGFWLVRKIVELARKYVCRLWWVLVVIDDSIETGFCTSACGCVVEVSDYYYVAVVLAV